MRHEQRIIVPSEGSVSRGQVPNPRVSKSSHILAAGTWNAAPSDTPLVGLVALPFITLTCHLSTFRSSCKSSLWLGSIRSRVSKSELEFLKKLTTGSPIKMDVMQDGPISSPYNSLMVYGQTDWKCLHFNGGIDAQTEPHSAAFRCGCGRILY
jgi:hypothetical protein